MFIIYKCVTNSAGQHYLAIEANCSEASLTLWSSLIPQHKNTAFYSAFEENCRQIVNCSLPSWKNRSLKFTNDGKMPPEKCPRWVSRPHRSTSKEQSYTSANGSCI